MLHLTQAEVLQPTPPEDGSSLFRIFGNYPLQFISLTLTLFE